MVAVEIVLIIIGVAFLLVSHFVQERFSEKEIAEIAKMSEAELHMVVDKQIKAARVEVENSVEEIIDESLEITKRGLEKETNEKIMAVSDFSETVLDNMNKTHNEIMFLYSMLNDKQAEMTELVDSVRSERDAVMKLSQMQQEARAQEQAKQEAAEEKPKPKRGRKPKQQVEIPESKEKKEAPVEDDNGNKNRKILALYKEGKSEVEIAKELECGLGEVRLVLGLFKG